MPRTRIHPGLIVLIAGVSAHALKAPGANAADFVLTPADSIQAAIDSAAHFDRLILTPGLYTQSFSMDSIDKTLFIQSQTPREAIFQAPPGSRIFSIASNDHTIIFEGVVFGSAALQANGALTEGGAGLITSSVVQFIDCVFKSNRITKDNNVSGTIRGGALSAINSTVSCDLCLFTDNSVSAVTNLGFTGTREAWGGAVFADGGSLNLGRCEFVGNAARVEFQSNSVTGWAQGGAVRSSNTLVWAAHCTFSNNEARALGASTGGRFAAGGAAFSATGLVMANCLLVGNSANGGTEGVGGAVCIDFTGFSEMLNCTMTKNIASHWGAGILSRSESVRMGNSIVTGNLVNGAESNFSGAFISTGRNLRGPSPVGIFTQEGPTDFVNISPGFLDPAAGDYRLAPGSICIDQAHAILTVDARLFWDLAFEPRAKDDPSTPNGPHAAQTILGLAVVDIGAFEFQPPPDLGACPTDVNGDGQVNATDLANVLGAWGACP